MLTNLARFTFMLFATGVLLSTPLYAEEKAETVLIDETKNVKADEDEEGAGTDKGKETSLKRVHLLPEVIEQAALADESFKKQIVWLETSEGESGALSSFLALELFEKASTPQGAVLLLHGVEQHPNWPRVIKPLRTILTEDGWYTLSIMLPYESYKAAPVRDLATKQAESVVGSDTAARFSGRYSKLDESRDEKSGSEAGSGGSEEENQGDTEGDVATTDGVDNAGSETESEVIEGEPTETAEDLEAASSGDDVIDVSAADKAGTESTAITFEERVQLRLSSALNHIMQGGYQNVVIVGYQQGAQGVLDYLARNRGLLPEEGLTIVLVDALLRVDQQAEMSSALGNEFSLLMLDVVDSSSRDAKIAAKERSGEAKRQSYTGYSQASVPIRNSAHTNVNVFTQRVRGWLKTNAPGMRAP